jgi:hypothetical protein
VVLAGAGALLFARITCRGGGLWIALPATLAAASASSIHYLARPHIFSLLLYTAALWVLDADRARRGFRLWLLVPVSALWANLHAGFVAWIATLALLTLVSAARRNATAVRRYGALGFACLAATLANPFGWHLHRHIWSYLSSSWILDHVQEFRSPDIRTEGMVVFATLLLLGAAMSWREIAAGRWFEGVLVLAWGLAAMRSARHVPFFAVAAAPVIAAAAASAWRKAYEGARRGTPTRVLWKLGQDLGGAGRLTIWLPVLGTAALAIGPTDRVADFPPTRFPVVAVQRESAVLTRPGARVLTSDQWADYLIFRLYPRQRVFFDGRSDFYGPELGADYRALLCAEKSWPTLLERYAFSVALLPHDWPLSTFLDRQPGWKRVYEDHAAVLFVKEREP